MVSSLLYSFSIHVYYIIEYVSELFNEVFDLIKDGADVPQLPSPPKPICATFDRPDKNVAVTQHSSRFLKKS